MPDNFVFLCLIRQYLYAIRLVYFTNIIKKVQENNRNMVVNRRAIS